MTITEVFNEAWCTECVAIKYSSKTDYQDEFTCNTCGCEVYIKQLKAINKVKGYF